MGGVCGCSTLGVRMSSTLSLLPSVREGDGAHIVETDRPSRPYRLHGPSRFGASYMLQIILQTNRTVMDCQTLPYTLSLYGHMLIIAIIVLILLKSIVLNFYCSLPDADCCMIGLLICSADGPKPYSFYCV